VSSPFKVVLLSFSACDKPSTYCSNINGALLTTVARAWDDTPWDHVEILTGKTMKPAPGRKKTILLGKCMYQANKDNPEIQEMISIKGCPSRQKDIINALHQAGIRIDSSIIEQMDHDLHLPIPFFDGQSDFFYLGLNFFNFGFGRIPF